MLFQKGALQMYNLGSNLRKRYYRLIPSNGLYVQNVMQITSSASERAMMSAQAFLAGFLPPLENRNKLPIIWQPSAIYVLTRDKDNLITQKMPCPKYDKIFNELVHDPSPEIRELNEKSSDLYKFLAEKTGLVRDKIK